MSHLVISAATKTFGAFTALHEIALTAERGDFVALLGPSGCGKSTLLRIIAGLETPDAGTIEIAGRDVTRLAPEKRNVALMFQSYALLPHMTVTENVRFPLRMKGGLPRTDQDEKVEEALGLVQLHDLGGRYPRQLSGGQQQRVALARAIVAEPDVLLLDEPLSNLDARLREDMQVELKRLHQTLGLTTVFVTHDQTEALALADTVVLMNAGRIERKDSPEGIYRNPGTVFAADFIGGANILTITVRRSEHGWSGTLADGTPIPLGDFSGLAPGRHRFMLRKEQVSVSPSDTGLIAISGTLEARNFLGGVTRSAVRAGGQQIIAVGDVTEPLAIGGEVTIGWRREDLVPLAETAAR
ncbi:ABC transporter ATP-binding protein [Rhodobium gokarnense]|uniref:ABC-type Fe3+/spermidine/putrescine transport system ATPase subunit n=1 Tax=Rhodobium gokarnense TaxID=364296 RepID=A0ABT3H6D2_9HYPH|nr:ABC transporter ATP-binding protein [Rhodobium gokarnense]MCW2305952.1 ABC-type Fe3+/spermidine/putrescine transport system ATPase subunit [Rhodobium gokarnense]